MAVPKVIEDQVQAAEAIRKDIYEGPAVVDGETPPNAQPASDATPPAPVAPNNVVELPKPAEPVKAAEPPVDPTQTAAYWKQRFDTLQGKFNAEMPSLLGQLRDQGEELRKLRAELEEKSTPQPAKAPDALVTQKDIDDFGEDLVNAMVRIARSQAQEAYAAERAALEKKFGAVETKVGEVRDRVVQSDLSNFWGEVSRQVPDWAAVDSNPSWIEWLNTTPEFSEASYRELAAQAISKGNVQKIVKLVEKWKAETGQMAPPPAPLPAEPAPQAVELSRQVAPSTVKSGTPPVAKKTLTRADYEALYDVRNVQRYGSAKAAEMIAEADQAVAEGRVQW